MFFMGILVEDTWDMEVQYAVEHVVTMKHEGKNGEFMDFRWRMLQGKSSPETGWFCTIKLIRGSTNQSNGPWQNWKNVELPI